VIAFDVDGSRQEVGVGANDLFERTGVEEEGGGGLEQQFHGGPHSTVGNRRQVEVLVAGARPAERRAALPRARNNRHLARQEKGAEETQAELTDQLGGFLLRLQREHLAQLARVASANGGEIGVDLLLGQPAAVVAQGQREPLRINGKIDARPVLRVVLLDPAADAGVVGVLEQLADADVLAGVEVLGQHFQQAGQVQSESVSCAHCLLGWELRGERRITDDLGGGKQRSGPGRATKGVRRRRRRGGFAGIKDTLWSAVQRE
jgi:hypothetical protein